MTVDLILEATRYTNPVKSKFRLKRLAAEGVFTIVIPFHWTTLTLLLSWI